MGFLFPDKHDIFVSYAHDDNQNFGGWIHDFATLFRQHFPTTLKRTLGSGPQDQKLLRRLTDSKLDIFVDHEGLPTAGNVDATLLHEVENSCFLFVFIGLGYVKSEWCEREFNYFGKRYSNISDRLVDFVQLIYLEQDAFIKMKGDGPAGDAKRKGFYKPAYDDQDRLPPARLNDGGAAVVNPQFEDLIKPIVETHVKRTIGVFRQNTEADADPPPPPVPGGSIIFGYPSASVRENQTGIIQEIEKRGFATASLTAEDVLDGGPTVTAKLRSAALFVVLFDNSSAKRLADQEELAGAAGARILWCWLDTAKDMETSETGRLFIKKIKAEAVKTPAPGLVDEILKLIAPPVDTAATILFDQQLEDQESCDEIKVYISQIWQREYQQTPRLRFLSFDLPIGEDSDLEPFDGVHGIVMIDRTRTDRTVLTRVLMLDDVLGRKRVIPDRSIFVLEPKREARNQSWPAIVFGRFQGRSEFDVRPPEKLNKFLRAVRDRAVNASNPGNN